MSEGVQAMTQEKHDGCVLVVGDTPPILKNVIKTGAIGGAILITEAVPKEAFIFELPEVVEIPFISKPKKWRNRKAYLGRFK